MKIDKELYNELSFSSEGESFEGFTVIEEGEWVVDGKYEHKRTVVQHDESQRYFALYESRSGSYFSDYHYDEIETDSEGMVELDEVFPEEVTTIQYL